jgi:hypothetical protein
MVWGASPGPLNTFLSVSRFLRGAFQLIDSSGTGRPRRISCLPNSPSVDSLLLYILPARISWITNLLRPRSGLMGTQVSVLLLVRSLVGSQKSVSVRFWKRFLA